LRKRTAAVHYKAGVEVAVCSKVRDEVAVCSGLGSRMTGGGSTTCLG
jgi:hypothetical protein